MTKHYIFLYIFFLIPASYIFAIANNIELYILSIVIFILGFICVYLAKNKHNKKIKSIIEKFL